IGNGRTAVASYVVADMVGSFIEWLITAACAPEPARRLRRGPWVRSRGRTLGSGPQGGRQLPPGADAELGEDVAQVPFDGSCAEEEPGADLRVGQSLAGQAGDL